MRRSSERFGKYRTVRTGRMGRLLIRPGRCALGSALLLSLMGCSYAYDLRAVVLDGRLAFIVDPSSNRDATCIRSIEVSAEGGSVARPGPTDDRQLVEHGVVWWKNTAVTQCLNSFPVLYGQLLKGEPFLPPGVEAKLLRVGTTYTVNTTGSGSGYGNGRFRIRADRTIENLPPVDDAAALEEPANGN